MKSRQSAPASHVVTCFFLPVNSNHEPGPSFLAVPPSGVIVNVPATTATWWSALWLWSGAENPAGSFMNEACGPLAASPLTVATFAGVPGTSTHFSSPAATRLTVDAAAGGVCAAGCAAIFLAGLQNIPDELMEAAKIDGANGVQVFRHITLPLMTPVIFFQLVLGLIGSFQQLNLPLILSTVGLTTGVPPRPIYLYMIHTYRQIFVYGRYGYGTALLWMLFVGTVVLTAIVFWSQKFWVYSEASTEGEQS